MRPVKNTMSGEGVRKVDIAHRSENFSIYFEDDKLEDKLRNVSSIISVCFKLSLDDFHKGGNRIFILG